MRSDLLDGVVVFTRVAEKRSFTAAARELNVTPAAVSLSIKQLERRIGVPLLTRTTRSVGLTDAGALFLEHARAGVAQLAAGFDAAQTLSERPTGLLRLNLPTVAQALIEPVLLGFASAYPDVELELVIEDRFIDIVAEGYDAGVRIGEMIAKDMVAVRLTGPSRCTVVGAPAYFERRGVPQRPEDLTDHACINIRQTSGRLYRWAFEEKQAGEARAFEMAVKGPLIVNRPGLCVSAAVAGIGLTYTVANTIEPLISDGRLQPCLESFMPSIPGFFLYFPSTAQVLPKLRAFLDYWRRERS